MPGIPMSAMLRGLRGSLSRYGELRLGCITSCGYDKHVLLRGAWGLSQRCIANGSYSKDDTEKCEELKYDSIVVGGGPAGLSYAIRLKQLVPEISVCVLEKGAEVGAHVLSGNLFNPMVLDELIPSWKKRVGEDEEGSSESAPLKTKVNNDKLLYLTKNNSITSPFLPSLISNHNAYVISLGQLTKYLAHHAESLGIDIIPGFSAAKLVYSENKAVVGIRTKPLGVGKDGKKKPNYEPPVNVLAAQTILAEGCHGSLSEQAIEKYNLHQSSLHGSKTGQSIPCSPQSYGLGFKELWTVPTQQHREGEVIHTIGWPLGTSNYGGGFLYHAAHNQVYIGFVVGLDYKNPYLNPYEEFQQWKHHSRIQDVLKGGECVNYGARCINEGGLQAIPKLTFPGGMLVGCSAGFLNVPRLKGTHYAMKSGVLAADAVASALMYDSTKVAGETAQAGASLTSDEVQVKLDSLRGEEMTAYQSSVCSSFIYQDLYKVRNIKPAFSYGGLWSMLSHAGLTIALGGREPWTLRWTEKDSESTQPAAAHSPVTYPSRIKGLSFNLLDNLARSGTNHEHDQPSHLVVKDGMHDVPADYSHQTMGAPESRFCPAGVYEYEQNEGSKAKLIINAQNCIHCKSCSIKTPNNFIRWEVPEGGGGPQYGNM